VCVFCVIVMVSINFWWSVYTDDKLIVGFFFRFDLSGNYTIYGMLN
jgi:hypothetical protein